MRRVRRTSNFGHPFPSKRPPLVSKESGFCRDIGASEPTDCSAGGDTKRNGCKQISPTMTSPYILQSGALRVELVSVGASIQRIFVPGRDGHVSDVVLGLENGEDYEDNAFFFGCVVGRVANRISKGRFRLNGREYQLETNNGASLDAEDSGTAIAGPSLLTHSLTHSLALA